MTEEGRRKKGEDGFRSHRETWDVIEEADESSFWLEFLALAGFIQPGTERALNAEANQLVAIFMQGRKTAQAKRAAKRAPKR